MSNHLVISGLTFDLGQEDDVREHHLADDLGRVREIRQQPRPEDGARMNDLYRELSSLTPNEIADRYLAVLDKLVEQRQGA
jgi:hypothetical protein